jgi:predicted Holliday junction resolvase-like endonuclease
MLMKQMTQMDDSSKERIVGILDKNFQEHTQTLEQFGKKQEEMKTEIVKTIDEKVDKSHAVLLDKRSIQDNPRSTLTITNSMEKREVHFIGTSDLIWEDWIELEDVNGWEQEYMDAVLR